MRDLLHFRHLAEFGDWLAANGYEQRPGKGGYQVLQIRLPFKREWHAIYKRDRAKEHYTVPNQLQGAVRRFIRERKNGDSNGKAGIPRLTHRGWPKRAGAEHLRRHAPGGLVRRPGAGGRLGNGPRGYANGKLMAASRELAESLKQARALVSRLAELMPGEVSASDIELMHRIDAALIKAGA